MDVLQAGAAVDPKKTATFTAISASATGVRGSESRPMLNAR